jgi:hypothetical protein
MRNYTKLVLGFGSIAFYFFYVGIWKPDYVWREESAWGVPILLLVLMVWVVIALDMIGRKHSDKAVGKAFCTDLMETRPLDSVKMPHPKNPSIEFTHLLFPANGNKPFMSRGGKRSGLFVVREDLIEVWTGDYTNLVFDAPFEIYRENPRKGERDITGLPKEIYDMVHQSEYYHRKGPVLWFADPGKTDPRRNTEPLTGLPYKDLYDSVNKANKAILDDYDKALETISKLSSANLKNARAYAGESTRSERRVQERSIEEDDRRDQER